MTKSKNYEPVTTGNQTNGDADIEINVNAWKAGQEKASNQQYILLPLMPSNSPLSSSTHGSDDKDTDEVPARGDEGVNKESGIDVQERTDSKEIGIFDGTYDDEDVGAEADLNNLETTMNVSTGSWVEAMQDELLQFKLQKVWRLVNLPKGKHAIRTKWVYRNKKDERGIVVRNKARLVAQGYTQEEGIDYDECLIEEEVYVCQPPGFEDPQFSDKVYKVYVDDIIFGSTKKSLCIEFEGLMHKKFQMSSMGELTFFLGLQVMQRDDGIFISQDKYVADILKKFDFSSVKTASTPMEPNKELIKDEEAKDVDVSHLHAVKRIFRYLKVQPKLGLWYPRDSPFDLEAFSDNDYARASLDRKSTTGDCQFLRKRLISWQCKKQTIVANSTTKANMLLLLIAVDRICIVKNPVFHSKTKHIEIRHHFIRYSHEKKLIQTATVRTVDNGEQEITATVDGKEFTVTEASVRRHLQLADAEAEEGEGSGHPSEPQPPPSTAQPTNKEPIPNIESSSHQKTQTPRQALDKVTELPQTSEPIPNVANEVVYEEWDDKVERATTTAASLDAGQTSGNITKTQSTTIPNVPLPQGIGAGGSPRCQEVTRGSITQTRSERVPTLPHDSPLPRVNKLGSDEGNDEEDSEDSSKQGRMIEYIDQNAGITLVTPTKVSSQEDQPEDQLRILSVAKVLIDAAKKNVNTYTRRRRAISTGSG
ncbi:putative ribonuclease H-like domain-containing protein [Tanacetum coccineum]